MINDKVLNVLLNEIDDYYDFEKVNYDYYGDFMPDNKNNDEIIKIISVNKIIDDKLNYPPQDVYKFKCIKCKITGLSMIVREILECKNNLKLSYLIADLLTYNCKDEEERLLLDKILLCFSFYLSKATFDLRRILLNYEYKLDVYNADPYYIDENTISKNIDNLPFLKTIS